MRSTGSTPVPRAPARAGGEPSGTCVHKEGGLSPERGNLRTDRTGGPGPTCSISLSSISLRSHLGPLYRNKKEGTTQPYESAEKQHRLESYSISLPPRVFISTCLRSRPGGCEMTVSQAPRLCDSPRTGHHRDPRKPWLSSVQGTRGPQLCWFDGDPASPPWGSDGLAGAPRPYTLQPHRWL